MPEPDVSLKATPRAITEEQLEHWFACHTLSDIQRFYLGTIREAGKTFAKVVLECTPPGADQSAAVRKIREAVATANMAIACDGR